MNAINPAELEQGSPEWAAFKCGKFSASRMGDLLAKGAGKTRASYLLEIVAERLTGVPCGFEGNDDTDFGNEQEPLARAAAEDKLRAFIVQVGFVPHPTMPYAGASPDGLIEEDAGLELKAHRKPITFLKHIEGEIPRDHLLQCQFGMGCTGRRRWVYGNWCPFMPEHMRLHLREVKRDEKLIAELVVETKRAEIEVAAKVAQYMKH